MPLLYMQQSRRNTSPSLKSLRFIGSSRDDLRELPLAARHEIGVELMVLQMGGTPRDFKPMPSVGAGTYELRIRDLSGAFRVVYVTRYTEAIYVLHAFEKKSRKTSRVDLELARRRYGLLRRIAL